MKIDQTKRNFCEILLFKKQLCSKLQEKFLFKLILLLFQIFFVIQISNQQQKQYTINQQYVVKFTINFHYQLIFYLQQYYNKKYYIINYYYVNNIILNIIYQQNQNINTHEYALFIILKLVNNLINKQIFIYYQIINPYISIIFFQSQTSHKKIILNAIIYIFNYLINLGVFNNQPFSKLVNQINQLQIHNYFSLVKLQIIWLLLSRIIIFYLVIKYLKKYIFFWKYYLNKIIRDNKNQIFYNLTKEKQLCIYSQLIQLTNLLKGQLLKTPKFIKQLNMQIMAFRIIFLCDVCDQKNIIEIQGFIIQQQINIYLFIKLFTNFNIIKRAYS
eukprot:TRINITY_DN2156_c1_g1_i1.p4 TRINITY_DN2156_c1_g1~~TRINITY_DN2156_c1_g1_i1.p4  ORF type:complete len:330 (-),score=-11.23 TRINITY_DN2156_c1_g1_i1:1262-2251(-)